MTAHAGPVHSGIEMGRAKAVWSRVENTDSITESWLRSWADDCQGLSLHCFSCKMEIIVVPTSHGTPLQYSCLENPMDGGAWRAAVHGVAEGRTRLSDFTFTFHFPALEKEMATHSSVLAWRIPGTGEPGGLPSMESHRVGHD